MDFLTRRRFFRQGGLGLLTFCVGGCEIDLSPGEARRQDVATRVLTRAEVTTLEALGDTLLPGSREAGIANYIDHQLGEPADRQRLMIKYLNVHPPFDAFYREGLAALERAAMNAADVPFLELAGDDRHSLVALASRENPPGWDTGPPAPFFYFVVRSDALDVTYGTMDGFAALGIPYMAHIAPPSRWGE